MKKNQELKGVTLVELLVVIGIFIILTIIFVPSFRYFQNESDLNNSAQEVINTLRLTQNKTLASEGASNFGVHFETEKFVLFEGIDYPSATNKETYNLPKNVEIDIVETNLAGGGTEVIFERLTGETNQFGKVSLRLKSDFSKTRTVGIESSGKITLGEESAPGSLPVKDSRHVHVGYSRFIDTATEKLTLTFEGVAVEEIIINDYLLGGEIDWEGEIEFGGDSQKLKIHTHGLNNPDTQFCIHRDRRYNNKSLKIDIDDSPDPDPGSLIEYSADGLTTNNTSFHADGPQWQ